jgi:hypothetical protein
MTFGTSLFMIALGAILKYAVTATVTGVNLHAVGVILMVIGAAGLVISVYLFLVDRYRARRRPPSGVM